jgi:hypothetical protein
MTFEEMERTMQFILERQAQLTVKHAEAEERMTRGRRTHSPGSPRRRPTANGGWTRCSTSYAA